MGKERRRGVLEGKYGEEERRRSIDSRRKRCPRGVLFGALTFLEEPTGNKKCRRLAKEGGNLRRGGPPTIELLIPRQSRAIGIFTYLASRKSPTCTRILLSTPWAERHRAPSTKLRRAAADLRALFERRSQIRGGGSNLCPGVNRSRPSVHAQDCKCCSDTLLQALCKSLSAAAWVALSGCRPGNSSAR